MAPSARRHRGLAAQILRVTLTIGIITVVAAGVVAIVGTSRIVSEQVATRDSAELQAIEDAFLTRYVDAETVAGNAARTVVATRDVRTLQATLTPVYAGGADSVAGLYVLDASLDVVADMPETSSPLPGSALRAARMALRGAQGVVRGTEAAPPGSLWLSQPVVTMADRPLVVLAEVDTRFIGELLQADAHGSRSVYLLEGTSIIASASPRPIDLHTARFDPTGSSGHISVSGPGGVHYSGYYNDVEVLLGQGWRLLILEPTDTVTKETLIALWPSVAVLALGGLVALLGAWIMARRLVAPLRKLQMSALRAAGGAYVKPIDSDRQDEIGQVARAFDAVALRLNALHDLSQLLASSSQLDQVLDGILSAMGHIVGPGVAAVYLLDDAGRWLVPVRARGADIANASAIDATDRTWLARALARTEPSVFAPGDRTLADELPGLAGDEPSALAAPLIAGNERLGVVVVLTEFGAHASDAEVEMMRTFSAQAAVAVRNSRLFAVESESRRVAEGLRSVAERLVRPGRLNEALTDIEATIAQLFDAERVSLGVVDRRSLGLPKGADPEFEAQSVGVALRIFEQGRPSRPVMMHAGQDPGADGLMQTMGVAEMLIAPVGFDTDHGAVLIVGFASAGATQRDLELADTLANEIALSLDNAYLYKQAVDRASTLETVFRISQAVGSSLDVKVVLNRVLDVVQKILSADAVALLTYDVRRRTIVTEMARGSLSTTMVDRVYAAGEDVVGYVFESGEPVSFLDLHQGMDGLAGDAARQGLRSMLAVPLLARGRSIGVLTVFSAEGGAFSAADTSMLQTFASQASLAIDTARLYSREHEVATVLQRSILPGALPEFDGIEAASAYEPAELDTEIGGDYYDLFRAPDGCVWLAIGDVCGKGVVAATKTSMIKYSVRAFVAAGFQPGQVVTEVNRMVAEGGDPSDIVTLWLGRIDRRSWTLTWANGGHPPALLRRSAGEDIEHLAAGGPLLGAIAGITYTDDSIDLEQGDAILLYTDGVTEARSGNRFFGEPRVEAAFRLGVTATVVVEELRSSVRRFVQSALRDDVAILAVRLTADGETATEPSDGGRQG